MNDEKKVLSKDEFCERFVAHMAGIATLAPGDRPDELTTYAREVAPTYYEEYLATGESPEQCATDDMTYWEGA